MSGLTNDTVLYILGSGTDGSTNILDTGKGANCPHAITTVGTIQIDTAQYKFAPSSILFDGAGWLLLDDSADWDFGTGDFTIDTFLKRSETGTVRHNIFGQGNAGLTGGYHLGYISASIGTLALGTFVFGMNDETYNPKTSGVIVDTNWHHIAVVRSGNNLMVALDGTFGSTVDVTGQTYTNSPTKFGVGTLGEFNYSVHEGWMQGFRITRKALWTADFTPPIAPATATPIMRAIMISD